MSAEGWHGGCRLGRRGARVKDARSPRTRRAFPARARGVPSPAVDEAAHPGGLFSGYSAEPRPLAGYAALAVLFNAGYAAALAAARRSQRGLPERIGLADVLLVGAGTHKLSRLLAKDRVTSFLRAPFTRFQEEGGPGEVEEEARGEGMRRAVGELVVCPYCIGLWVAAGFTLGLVAAPRETRVTAAMFAALAASDALQLLYKAGQEQV